MARAAPVTKKIQKTKKLIRRTRTIEETLKSAEGVKTKGRTRQLKKQEPVAVRAAMKQPVNKKKKQPANKRAPSARPKPQRAAQVVQLPVVEKRTLFVKRDSSILKGKGIAHEDIPKFINMEELREDQHELDEHHNFKEKFLGIEGAFSAYKVLVGLFYSPVIFERTAGAELKKKDF